MTSWLAAFVLTQVLEIPVWMWAGRKVFSSKGRNFLCAFGASAITHPVLWFAFPWGSGDYYLVLIVGETFVFVVEALWAKWWGLAHPWGISALANGFSLGIGLLVQQIFH